MPLDIVFFRKAAGYDPEVIRASQRKRFQDPAVVDKVIELDEGWRQAIYRGDGLRRVKNVISKAYGKLKKDKAPEDGPADVSADLQERIAALAEKDVAGLSIAQLSTLSRLTDAAIADAERQTKEFEQQRDKLVESIGNIVHEGIVVSQNEDENTVVRTHGEPRRPADGETLLIHVDLMQKIGGLDSGDRIARISGSRAYYLKGDLVLLHLGLVNYAMRFLHERGYTPIEPPVMMNREYLAGVCQLSDFAETLYAVHDGETERYLVATAEQPICAWHANKHFTPKELPLRWAGFSACYRKEAGSHGRDTTGIFRVHQFDKVEQFVVTTKEDSWAQLETMITNSEDFCKSLGLSYRVVDICTGALNNAAARKYDLEAWFPGSKAFRELVSCSNCTDYQSRAIGAKLGNPPTKAAPGGKGAKAEGPKDVQEYVHMLNGTLCALSRTLCCIVEQYQCAEGIRVPEVLRPYMPHGRDLIPFLPDEPAPAAPAPKAAAAPKAAGK